VDGASAPIDAVYLQQGEQRMASTFETVAKIISSTSDVPLERITPDSHIMKDLEVDSLAFLDVTFEIDQAFGIRLPVEEWLQNAKDGYDGEQYFILRTLCEHIDALVTPAPLMDRDPTHAPRIFSDARSN
jgi:acyl carrier protein